MMLIKFLKLVVKTFFREINVKGLENLPDSGQAIFTPNHPNALLDPLLLFFLPPAYRIRFVAKAPLFKISLLGWMMRKMGAIPVFRRFESDGQVDYKAFFASCVDALADGDSIAIFPEGASLPQPYMTVMKTGAARLFFLAREKDIPVRIVPVGLNYEHGSIFRTPVVVWVSAPLETDDVIEKHNGSPQVAIRELTERIGRALEECVFQSENFLDRELMLLLERIHSEDKASGSWLERLERLKQFEAGLNALRDCCPCEINLLRQMLSRHKKLTRLLKAIHFSPGNDIRHSPKRFFMALIGLPFAALGWLFTILPYQLCNLIVKYVKKYDVAAAATYKVIYSLFLFPITFLAEGILLHLFFGWAFSITFAIIIIPLSYFTLYFFEWLSEGGWGMPISSYKLRKTFYHRLSKQLEEQRGRIKDLIDDLAGRLVQHP